MIYAFDSLQATLFLNFSNVILALNMEIHHSDYSASYPKVTLCPKDNKPEYAFIGRSNVGKSSLINMLLNRKELARVSKKPGKTQMINYYIVNKEWYLVDLPGYGYAKISKNKRKEWRQMIEGYLQKRVNMQCAFVLLDANIAPQKIDIEFINWLGQARVPFVIVYTKADKSKPQEIEENIEKIQQALLEHWNELPQQFTTSANKGEGQEEILQFIDKINHQFLEQLEMEH